MTPVFTGRVTDAGKLILDSPLRLNAHLRAHAGKRVEVVVRRVRSKRSNEANRYYWGVVVPILAEELGYEKEECHEVLAMHFLRIEDCPITGAPRRRRTPDCDTKEFAEYVDSCIRLASEYGVYVPQPNEVAVPVR